MPPLLADFIYHGACKPICEKSLTLPFSLGMMLMKEVYEFMENSKN